MIAALFLSLLAAAPASATVDRRPPVDRCATVPGFAAFRTSLREAATRRDAAFIRSVLAEDILVNFGGDSGRDAFVGNWRLGEPDSPFWAELSSVLTLGCAPIDEELVAPSMVAQLDDQDDPSSAMLALPGAVMRTRPDATADVVARLEWDVLRWRSDETPDDWMAVALADGRQGYVRRGETRSPLEYRAYFRRIGGQWRITAFIAGD
jgi:hypothetical protein